jgi:nucleoside-diphosphate-sugar epimerase
MKIAITGHTRGIGKALSDGFASQGHEVIGFSRSTTPNLSSEEGIEAVANASIDCDMIVINAYDFELRKTNLGFAQTTLLLKMWELWKDKDKIIVTIGSRSSDGSMIGSDPVPMRPFYYYIHKCTLDLAVKQLRNIQKTNPQIINLKPGYVDTDMISHVTAKKLDPKDVFELLDWAIKHKNLILDLSFTVR